MVSGDYRELPLGELFERTAEAETPAPGGGSIAALTAGMAAALVAMVARSSRGSWTDAGVVAAQAIELAGRCPALARGDADAWEQVFAAMQEVNVGRDGTDGVELADLLRISADLPVTIAEIGADVAVLAALAARLGDGNLRADATSAAVLAQAATRVAAHLVTVNLAMRDGDERLARVSSAEWRAGQAVAEALAAGP